MSYDILVLNPGSTSTKAAVYRDERPLMARSVVHTNTDLAPYPTLNDQLDYRVGMVRSWLALEGYDLSGLSAVILSLLAPVQVFFLVFFAILFLGIALTYFMSWKWFKDKERQHD